MLKLLPALRQAFRKPAPVLRPNNCPPSARRPYTRTAPKSANPADDPNFLSIVDNPPVLVRAGGPKHGPGLILLALIPLTAFALGTWQVQRLKWKTGLLSRYEDRLLRPPLPLPARIDPAAVPEFEYRRVSARGRFRHDAEMLLGPRLQDGDDGFLVVTPFEQLDAAGAPLPGSAVLVNRGWIPRALAARPARRRAFATAPPNGSVPADVEALPDGAVTVEGLLRTPWVRNTFTPANTPAEGKWYFPDVAEMAAFAGTQPVWVDATVPVADDTLLQQYDKQARGIPCPRPAKLEIRNNHLQYIATWYALGIATSVMFWMLVKKPPRGPAGRVRRSVEWS